MPSLVATMKNVRVRTNSAIWARASTAIGQTLRTTPTEIEEDVMNWNERIHVHIHLHEFIQANER